MRRSALLMGGLLTVVLAAPAGAATVEQSTFGFGIQIADQAAETNTLAVALTAGGQIRVADTTTPPTPGTGCAPDGANAVLCDGTVKDVNAFLGGGDDEITFGDGLTAVVNGGTGLDTITGADGPDDLVGGAGADTIRGGAGADLIEGGDGDDDLFGGPGNDAFNRFPIDQSTNAILDTDAGDDDLDGEDGSDSLNGGRGGDRMVDTGTDGLKDEVHYGRGDHDAGVGVVVTMGAVKNDGNTADGLQDDVGAGIEQVVGTKLGDELTGTAGADTLLGAAGDDRLNGGLGADTLVGQANDDTLEAQDGVADTRLDCDDTSGPQGTSDVVVRDAGVDPAPVRCEVLDGAGGGSGGGSSGGTGAAGGGSTPAPVQTTGVQPPRTAGRPTIARDGTTLTCRPGAWSAVPTFTYGWFAVAGGTPAPLGQGASYRLRPADQGKLVYCLVAARSTGGTAVARSVLLSVPRIVLMPELQSRPLPVATRILMDLTGGAITLKTKRRGRAQIDCVLGGSRGSDEACDSQAARNARSRLQHGDVYVTTPKDGRTLEADAATGALPTVTLGVYDRSLNSALPPVETKRKFGDDCPLTGAGFTSAEKRDFVAGLQGKYERVARATLDQRECRFVVKDQLVRDLASDPFVAAIEPVEIDDRNGLRLTIQRARRPDLVVIPYHRRLQGRDDFAGVDVSRGEINPGLGSDGKLTTLAGPPNDVCFHVREASTGRPVPGAVVRALAPDGRLVTDQTQAPQGGATDAQGNRCDRWRIHERGEYRFTFDYRGTNGVGAEGWLRMDAVSRNRESYTTISGRRLECVADRCVQTGTAAPRARAAVVVESVLLVAAVGVLVKGIIDARARGVDAASAARAGQALGGGNPEVSLFRAAGTGAVTPAFLTVGGKLAPGAGIVSGGAGNLIGQDGAGIISGGAGNAVPARVASITVPAGGGLTSIAGAGIVSGGAGNVLANDGASIVSGGAGNLIGQDGAGIISGGAGNLTARGGDVVRIGERTVITEDGKLPAGTMVATGLGAGIPVAPIVSGGAGNLIGQDGAGLIGQDGAGLIGQDGAG